MQVTLGQLADELGGSVLGDASLVIGGAGTLLEANSGEITFSVSDQLTRSLRKTRASAVLLAQANDELELPQVIVADPQEAFTKVVARFHPRQWQQVEGISPAAHIHPSVVLGKDVRVGPGCFLGEGVVVGDRTVLHAGVCILAGSRLGEDNVLFPHVVLYESTLVGNRCRIHAGVVLGADGFGYSVRDGQFQACSQLGWVEIGDDVEIGANSTVDRGTYGPTTIGAGAKIDNLVMIGHNCRIGAANLLCSQVGIAGSSSTGEYVVMGGQVGVKDHVNVGAGARLGAQSGVSHDIPAGESYFGSPALPARQAHRVTGTLHRLPELRRELRELRKLVESLTAGSSGHPDPHADAA